MAKKVANIGLKPGVVRLAEHNPEWARLFKSEARCIRKLAGEFILDIQHVGSTSVPGLVAKPILDIAVAVPDRDTIMAVVRRLTGAGYTNRGDQGKGGGYLLVREYEPGVRICYVHIVEASDEQWQDYIIFRDILRHDPAIRQAYADLKKRLSAQFPEDRVSYTAGKDAFIQGVLDTHKCDL